MSVKIVNLKEVFHLQELMKNTKEFLYPNKTIIAANISKSTWNVIVKVYNQNVSKRDTT